MQYRVLLITAVCGAIFVYSANATAAQNGGYDASTAKAIEESSQAEKEIDAQDFNEKTQKSAAASYSGSTTNSSVNGFYAGVGVGIDAAKAKFEMQKTETSTEPADLMRNSSESGFNGNFFSGYNFQMGNIILGLECLIDMSTAKNITTIGAPNDKSEISVKRKYSFGIAPRIGYAIFGGLSGYLSVGASTSKYSIINTDPDKTVTKKHPLKTSVFVGVGLEQSFGSLFVRGECNRIFKKNIATVATTAVSSSSYIFRAGCGYRF